MKLRTQDLFLALGFAAPIILFLTYWAAEGFRMPLSQRYSLYVAQDPTLPITVFVSFAAAAYLAVSSVEESERHQEFFNQAARWFFIPVYLTIALSIMLWYRFDFSSPFPAVSIFETIGRTLPSALSILLPTLLILGLGILSLPKEARASLLHSVIILLGATLIFGGAFLQFLLSASSSGRLNVGYAGAAGIAYAAMILGGVILLYSLRRFARGQAATSVEGKE